MTTKLEADSRPSLVQASKLEEAQNESLRTAAVAPTLPAYWPQNPDAWFVKVEAQLKAAKITNEETAYYKVSAVLPKSASIRVREISHKPNFELGDYEKLEQNFISNSQAPILERLEKLCELENIMQKKPSEVLLELEILFHSSKPSHVIPMTEVMKKFWWLRALPTSIEQCLLPLAESLTQNALVLSADRMFASNYPIDRVSEVQQKIITDT